MKPSKAITTAPQIPNDPPSLRDVSDNLPDMGRRNYSVACKLPDVEFVYRQNTIDLAQQFALNVV